MVLHLILKKGFILTLTIQLFSASLPTLTSHPTSQPSIHPSIRIQVVQICIKVEWSVIQMVIWRDFRWLLKCRVFFIFNKGHFQVKIKDLQALVRSTWENLESHSGAVPSLDNWLYISAPPSILISLRIAVKLFWI